MYKTYSIKTTKHYWEIWNKTYVIREVYLVHGSEDTMLLRCQFSPNWAIDSTQSKSQQAFFAEIGNLILKFLWKCKGPRIAKTTLTKTKVREPKSQFQTLLQSYSNQNI